MTAARAFASAAAAVVVAGCSATSGGAAHGVPTGAPTAIERPDIVHLSEAMVVSQGSFPVVDGAAWQAPYVDQTSNDGTISPAAVPHECTPILHGWAHGKRGYAAAMLKGGSLTYKVELTLPSEGTHPDIAALVPKCGTIVRGNQTYQVARKAIPNLPSWATALRIDTQGHQVLGIFGRYRGVDIAVYARQEPTVSPEDVAADTKLFTDQLAKLQAV